MNIRHFSVVAAIAFIIALFPLNVFANNAVTINTITDKYQGDSVTISGTTVFDEVTIKVLRPTNTILYVNVLEGGIFSDTFTLPEDAEFGRYTVIAGKGQDIAAQTFNVIRRGGGSTVPLTPLPASGEPGTEVQDDGAVKIVTKPSLDEGSSTAVSIISMEVIEKASEQAKEVSGGSRVVILEIPEIEGAEKYSVQLPADALSSGGKDKRIDINTVLGTVSVPGNMFSNIGLVGEENVEIVIGFADRTDIDEDIRRQIGDRPVIELNAKVDGQVISWNNPDAPVTVSIDYTPAPEELEDPEHIVVWYIDGKNNVVSVPNGRYDPASGKVIFTITHFSKYAVVFVKKTFSDIENYPWAKKQIEVLASKGIINGTSATTYSPGLSITRADFITLLIRALELKAEFSTNFDDVNPEDYFYDILGTARILGIATGVGNNKFNPGEQISRQDMMVLTARALKIAGKISESGTISDLAGFSDASEVSVYAVEGVVALIKEGIIQGSGNRINPKGTATRAEAAVVIYRVLNK